MTAFASEGLMIDCHNDEIVEFGFLDYYTLMYLDLFYILRKTYEGIVDHLLNLKESLFKKD